MVRAASEGSAEVERAGGARAGADVDGNQGGFPVARKKIFRASPGVSKVANAHSAF